MSQQTPPTLDELWESIPTGTPPVDELVDRGRATRRRRRVTSVVAVAAAAAMVVGVGAVVASRGQGHQGNDVVSPPAGTRLAALGRVAVAVPAGWADGAATCNSPTKDTVYFPYPQDCLGVLHSGVSSVALTTGPFAETGTRLGGLEPTGHVDGHQVVAGPTSCRTDPELACVAVFGVPDLHAYVTVTVPRTRSSRPFDVIDGIRASLRVLSTDQTAVPFVTPESGIDRYRAALETAGLHVDVRDVPCPDTAFCASGVWGTSPAAGAVVPAGSTVTIRVITSGD